ncbi:ferredoxin [Micromonospora sp. RTGN7]|uniref:ferredoxin n=1 Tax=Micromonospora sp. RTGN7 TaxID=3016526 RepID=UPI0039B6ED63
MRVRADREACVGSGLCALRLPELFDQSEDDGTVLLLRAEPEPDQEAAALEVVEVCPSRALRIDRA